MQPAPLLPLRPVDLAGVDPRFLATHGIVPLGIDADRLVVTVAGPVAPATIAALGFAARRAIDVRASDAPPPPAPSLAGRIAAGFGDGAVARWVMVDMLAQLLAEGATPAAACARIAAAGGDPAAGIDWAGPIATLADPAAVARQLRAELDMDHALRRAIAVPGALLVLAVLVIGGWGLLPGAALIGFRGVAPRVRAARRTGRAVALGTADSDPAALTIAEQDRIGRHAPAVAAALWDRARLTLSAASARVTSAMLLMLAMLAVVRLG